MVFTSFHRQQLGSGKAVFPVTLECSYRSASSVHYRSTTKLEKTDKLIIADFDVCPLKRLQFVRKQN
jgi:hypothetical protein